MSQRSTSPHAPSASTESDAKGGDPALLRRQARSAAARGDRASAILLHVSALEADPADAEGHFDLGVLLSGIGRIDEAVAALGRASELAPSNPQVRHNLGLALARTGETDRARAELAAAVRLAPDQSAYLRALALFHLAIGKAADAEGGFRMLIARDQYDSGAHRNLARLARYSRDDPHIAEMERLLDRGGLGLDAEVDLGFALFDALGKAGRHEDAFRRLSQANRLRRRKFPYDAAAEQMVFEQLRDFFDAAFVFDPPSLRTESTGPIFIIGMPRAGTTLVEQVLSSHPDIAAGGESIAMTELVRRFLVTPQKPGLTLSAATFSPDQRDEMRAFYLAVLRDVAGRAPRFTDKMPLNFRWVGVIAAIMPEARFVHCRRDPVETCFSIHSSFLGRQPLQP